MLFSSSADTKLAVLQEKINSNENMVNKLDEAIQIIGVTNQNITKMLAVHEEKLESSSKVDASILTMINDMKKDEDNHKKELNTKIDDLRKKIEEVTNFRWLMVGGMILVTVILSAPAIFSDLLTPDAGGARITAPAAAAEPPESPSVRRQPSKK